MSEPRERRLHNKGISFIVSEMGGKDITSVDLGDIPLFLGSLLDRIESLELEVMKNG